MGHIVRKTYVKGKLSKGSENMFRAGGGMGLQVSKWAGTPVVHEGYTGPSKPSFSSRKRWISCPGRIPRALLVRLRLLFVPETLRGMHSEFPEAQFLHQNGVPEG